MLRTTVPISFDSASVLTITLTKLSPDVVNLIYNSSNVANNISNTANLAIANVEAAANLAIANVEAAGATTGKAIAMSIVFGG